MRFTLGFGAFAAPIREQLSAQGLKGDAGAVQHAQKDADAITRLLVRGLITESTASKARKKLLSKLHVAERRKLNEDHH